MGDLIDGTTVRMAGQDYTVPPLSFKQLRNLRGTFEQIASVKDGAIPTDEQIGAMIDIVHAALTRNYPELTKEQVENMIDLKNMQTIVTAIMGVSGLLDAGEVKAGN